MASPPAAAVVIDGSLHEGGGQIVRNAVALAAAARTPVTVTSIRAGRPKPGLRPQHVAGLRLVASLSAGGVLAGCEVGSTELTFTPGHLRAGPHTADAGTAGSTMLMAQAALPAALLAAAAGGGAPPSSPLTTTMTLIGGTDAAMAPPADYAAAVLLPTLRAGCGITADLAIHRRGFFPRGGGRVEVSVRALPPGQALPPVVLERGGGGGSGGGGRDDAVASVTVYATHAGRVKRAAVETAIAALAEAYGAGAGAAAPPPAWPPPAITALPPAAAPGDGGSVTAVAATRAGLLFGAAAPLGPKDDPAEVGARLGRELAEDVGGGGAAPAASASVDRWLGDQLVVFGALAAGRSRWTTAGPPTPHARAAMEVATKLTGARFAVREHQGGGWTVECEGAGVAAGM